MKRRDAFRTLSAAMLAPFVARADPTKPLQQELNEVWDSLCVHRWSPKHEHCVKCGMSRQQMLDISDEVWRAGRALKRDIEFDLYAKHKP